MVEFEGRIVRGFGWATGFLKNQIPLIAQEYPQIARIHRGSINVKLNKPLRIFRPDFVSSPIDWGKMKEVFHFTRIRFQMLPKNKKPSRWINGWIYGPQNSPHRPDPFYIEIVARKIPLKGTKKIQIRIPRDARVVPLTIID